VDAIVDSIASKNQDVIVNNIKYHVSWPSSADPFYQYNIPENTARTNYYGVNAVPREFLGGQQFSVDSQQGLISDITARLLIPPLLEIAVSDTLMGDSVYVNARVIATGDVDTKATFTFQCVAVEWRRPASSRQHWYIMRDMVPDAGGESFTISQGDTLDFERVWWMDPGTYIDWKMNTVVFVQDEGTREILNSASANPPPDHFLWYMAGGNPNTMIPVDGTAEYTSMAYNLGTVPDTFDIDIQASLPAGWTASYTTSQGTFSGPSQIFLGPGEEEIIPVTVDPNNIPGFAQVQMLADGYAGTDPVTRTASFNCLHEVDILLVDDDGGEPFEGYYQAALDATGFVHGTWNRLAGEITLADLSTADAVVWWTGLAFPTFTVTDRNILSDYLDNGGNLFATGQDIGWSLCDLSSSWWSVNGCNWYGDYLSASYVRDDTNDMTLTGVPGDPISDGMALTISGGDGANNQAYPDEIEPVGSAFPIFLYEPEMEAGVRYNAWTFKTVYLGFGLEAIDNATDRATLMQRVLDWFFATTDVAESESVVKPAWLAQNAPNPFNPDTKIQFYVPSRSRVRLNVYNVHGQMVRVLEDGDRDAGEHVIHWDGLDHAGRSVASGVYFYSLEAGDFTATKKMTLLR
jgi:hypothetical protein